ncbi:hypothetical protein SCUCBS95973_000504 [Sporothrix curviconia]|uniref:Uncharacterized protein n=1 Tax=Sporothrix curviconia TaxID=1260050 RepID=A0ABP0AQU1_9PEZI
MPYLRPLDYVRRVSYALFHSCRCCCCFCLRPPFPHCVVFAQTCAAALVGVILFGPPFIHLYCGGNHGNWLLDCLGLLLLLLGVGGSSTCNPSTWLVALVANYAYLLGFLFSLGDPLGGGGELRSSNHAHRYLLDNSVNADNSEARETLAAGRIARTVVGLAFDSGRAQSLGWPPADSPETTMTVSMLRDNALGSVLLQKVYPLTVVAIIFPALVYLFYSTTRQLLRRLHCSTLGACNLHLPLRAAASNTHAKHDASDSAVETAISRHTSVGSFTPSPPSSPIITTKVLFRGTGRPAGTKPPSPLRVCGRVLVGILKIASGTLAEGAVETLAPFVFGAILIVTTATAIVLYGIGHIGVASLTESGVFGLTKDAVDTLLGLVRMQWRFLRQLRWSWWLDTAARYERRYEDHVLGVGQPDHVHDVHDVHDAHDTTHTGHTVQPTGHHDNCVRTDTDTNCILHWHLGTTGEPSVRANDHFDPDDAGMEANTQNSEKNDVQHAQTTGRRRFCQHFHRDHHHHHHNRRLRCHHRSRPHQRHLRRQRQPGLHIRLEKRRDWVRWFFGRPHMTTAEDPQQASVSLASAAAEVAEGLFGQVLIQPGTDGLIPIVGGIVENDAAQTGLFDQQSARSGSGIHFFANNFDPADFNPNDMRDTYSPALEIIVPDEPAFLSREAPDLALLPPVVPFDVSSTAGQGNF